MNQLSEPKSIYVIRLRRPWQKSRDGGTRWTPIDVPEVGPAQPDDSSAPLYRRGFNLPSGLQPPSRVFLRVDGWEGQLESITVNGSPLETGSARVHADITSLLQPHNQILVRLRDSAGAPARMSGEVTLAICDADDRK